MKVVGEPYAGKPHVRFDEGALETCGCLPWRASTLLYVENPLPKPPGSRPSEVTQALAGSMARAPPKPPPSDLPSRPEGPLTFLSKLSSFHKAVGRLSSHQRRNSPPPTAALPAPEELEHWAIRQP